jgi:EmrB/QacA subfamily drug resistance transporter
VAVCVGTFMLLLDVTAVNVALPGIQANLHASLADLYGRRLMYLIGLVIFTGASALCGFAVSPLMLQLSRGLQGVGGAIMLAVSLALLANAFRGRERGRAFGVWGLVTGLAFAIGPLVGGLLTSGISWRWIFFVNIPFGIAAVITTRLRVTESRAGGQLTSGPDWTGFVLFTAALSTLVYGLIEASRTSFTDHLVLVCFALAVVLMAAFVVAELLVAHPMFDLALFLKPTFTGASVAAFGTNASIYATLPYIVLYLQDILGYSALGTGVRLVILSGGMAVTATIAGRLSARVPVRWLIGPGLLLIGVGLLLMRGLDARSTWTHLIPGLIAGGLGIGLSTPPLASTAVGVVPPERAGMASGINSTFRQVGIATGIALLGALFSAQVRGSASRAAFTAGLNRILLVAAIIALVAGVISLVAIRRKDFAHH